MRSKWSYLAVERDPSSDTFGGAYRTADFARVLHFWMLYCAGRMLNSSGIEFQWEARRRIVSPPPQNSSFHVFPTHHSQPCKSGERVGSLGSDLCYHPPERVFLFSAEVLILKGVKGAKGACAVLLGQLFLVVILKLAERLYDSSHYSRNECRSEDSLRSFEQLTT
jgi:hypothetical protein